MFFRKKKEKHKEFICEVCKEEFDKEAVWFAHQFIHAPEWDKRNSMRK